MSVEADWPWSELGLSGPATDRDIRRAYATRLKRIDPEADPKSFEGLRMAYEYARELAEYAEAEAEPAVQAGPLEMSPESLAPPVAGHDAQAAKPDEVDPDMSEHPAEEGEAPSVWPNSDGYAALIDEMQALIKAGDYNVDRWQRLLADTVLEDLWLSEQFERALADALWEKGFSGKDFWHTGLKASRDWLALIEARYGWLTDGLRFRDLFPAYGALREVFDELRPRSAQASPAYPPLKQTDWRRILLTLVSPGVLGLLGIFLTFRFRNYLDQPTVSVILMALALMIAVAFGFSSWPPARHWRVTTRGLQRLRLGFLARALAGVRLSNIACSAVMVALLLGAGGLVLAGGITVQEIRRGAVQIERAKIQIADPPDFVSPGYFVPYRLKDESSIPGNDDDRPPGDPVPPAVRAAQLSYLDLPFPRVRLEIPRPVTTMRQGDTAKAAADAQPEPEMPTRPAMLNCEREGKCQLLLTGALQIISSVWAPSVDRRLASGTLDTPVLQLTWQRGNPASV